MPLQFFGACIDRGGEGPARLAQGDPNRLWRSFCKGKFKRDMDPTQNDARRDPETQRAVSRKNKCTLVWGRPGFHGFAHSPFCALFLGGFAGLPLLWLVNALYFHKQLRSADADPVVRRCVGTIPLSGTRRQLTWTRVFLPRSPGMCSCRWWEAWRCPVCSSCGTRSTPRSGHRGAHRVRPYRSSCIGARDRHFASERIVKRAPRLVVGLTSLLGWRSFASLSPVVCRAEFGVVMEVVSVRGGWRLCARWSRVHPCDCACAIAGSGSSARPQV